MYGSRYGSMGSMGLGGYGMGGSSYGMGGYGSAYGMGGSSYGMSGYGYNMGGGSMMGSNLGGLGGFQMNTNNVGGGGINPLAVNGQLQSASQQDVAGPLSRSGDPAQQKSAIIAEQKRQRRQFLIDATMQLVTGVSQLLLQILMGVREVASIAITLYCGYHTLRSFRQSISGGGEMVPTGYYDAMGNPTFAHNGGPISAFQGGVPTGGRSHSIGETIGSSIAKSLRVLLGTVAVYSIGHAVVKAYGAARESYAVREAEEQRRSQRIAAKMEAKRSLRREQRIARRRQSQVNAEGADNTTDRSWDSSQQSSSEDCSSCSSIDSDDGFGLGASAPRGRVRHSIASEGTHRQIGNVEQREHNIYVALFDHEATGQGGDVVSFRAGDQFEIADFNPASWCSAVRLGDGINGGAPINVPGNFLKPLRLQQRI